MNDTFEKDKKYILGTYNRFPVNIVRGKGSLVYDENGKEYIDMGSGIGVTSFGISDDIWQNAIIGQISTLQHMSNLYYTDPCVELARILCERTGMKKVFFSNSGAEANECAIKLARKYAYDKYGENRYTIVTLKNSFHGRTLTTLAATGQEHYHELYNPLTPGFESIECTDINKLEEIHSNTPVAGVLMECIQGEGGVLTVSSEFALKLQNWCRNNDALFMIDEVQTGNGRTGSLYAYMNYGLAPDVVSTAKGLAGGLPLGATLVGEKAEGVMKFGDHGSTFGGNPVCCAGAISIINRIDDELLSQVRKKGEYIISSLQGKKGISDISGMGLMIGIKTDKPASELIKKCMQRGVLCLSAKDKLRLLPALNIGYDLLERALEVIAQAASEE